MEAKKNENDSQAPVENLIMNSSTAIEIETVLEQDNRSSSGNNCQQNENDGQAPDEPVSQHSRTSIEMEEVEEKDSADSQGNN
jgi:hypothetical protein